MKNLQKLALALLVGVMAVGFSAFKAETKNKLAGELWFDYTSSSTSPSDYNLSANYDLAGDGSEQPDCPTGNFIRCAVHAQPLASDPSKPDMSTVIATRDRRE